MTGKRSTACRRNTTSSLTDTRTTLNSNASGSRKGSLILPSSRYLFIYEGNVFICGGMLADGLFFSGVAIFQRHAREMKSSIQDNVH